MQVIYSLFLNSKTTTLDCSVVLRLRLCNCISPTLLPGGSLLGFANGGNEWRWESRKMGEGTSFQLLAAAIGSSLQLLSVSPRTNQQLNKADLKSSEPGQ